MTIVSDPPKVAVRSDWGTTYPVKEGVNVTLKCETVARPDPHSYSWYHNVSIPLLFYHVGLLESYLLQSVFPLLFSYFPIKALKLLQ